MLTSRIGCKPLSEIIRAIVLIWDDMRHQKIIITATLTLLAVLYSSCSESLSVENRETCTQLMEQENELFFQFKDGQIGRAEFVGDSSYTKKIGGAHAHLPENTFFCSWSITGLNGNDRFLGVMFLRGTKTKNSHELLNFFETEVTDRGNKTIRAFDYQTLRFDTYE